MAIEVERFSGHWRFRFKRIKEGIEMAAGRMNGVLVRKAAARPALERGRLALERQSVRLRSSYGGEIAELGPTLWIVFMIFLFPLIAFGTIGLRYGLFVNAA